ncbi:aminoacyl-tRNA hydrolase [Endozoicomonadaceae bacterium StTr2]
MAKPSHAIKLIVGLGNPGPEYEATRHNAGVWFIEQLARDLGVTLQHDKKMHGAVARATVQGSDVRLLVPSTYMNLSGQAVTALSNFYKIPTESILVAHDELDIPPGEARLKIGGGHGGHNGLRDIISKQGNNKNFMRLRLGIGHPGEARLVTNYVLGRPSRDDIGKIDGAVDEAVRVMPKLMAGDWDKAVQQLHTFKG